MASASLMPCNGTFFETATAEPVDKPAAFVSTQFPYDDLVPDSAGVELSLPRKDERWKSYAGDTLVCRGKPKSGNDATFGWTKPNPARFITASNVSELVGDYDGKWCVGMLDDVVVRLWNCPPERSLAAIFPKPGIVPRHIFRRSISSCRHHDPRMESLNITFLMPQRERRCILSGTSSRF